MFFSASLDKLARVLTIVIVAILAGFVLSIFFIGSIGGNGELMTITIGAVFFLLIILICYGYHTKGYKVEDNTIIIIRLFGNKVIENIKSVSKPQDAVIRNSIRTFGVGGLFGYFGYFYNSNIGRMTWFATQMKNFVLVETEKTKKIVVTPDSQDKFIEAVKNII